MKLSEIKLRLTQVNEVNFVLPNNTSIPQHFHITEVGVIDKTFIDCGGVIRNEKKINFQLWNANDFDHRVTPTKFMSILNLAEQKLNLVDAEIEIEYQGSTINKYSLDFDGKNFLLLNQATACLASDQCGTPSQKQKINLSELSNQAACIPGSGCCN